MKPDSFLDVGQRLSKFLGSIFVFKFKIIWTRKCRNHFFFFFFNTAKQWLPNAEEGKGSRTTSIGAIRAFFHLWLSDFESSNIVGSLHLVKWHAFITLLRIPKKFHIQQLMWSLSCHVVDHVCQSSTEVFPEVVVSEWKNHGVRSWVFLFLGPCAQPRTR